MTWRALPPRAAAAQLARVQGVGAPRARPLLP
jgi:hypothetical protein